MQAPRGQGGEPWVVTPTRPPEATRSSTGPWPRGPAGSVDLQESTWLGGNSTVSDKNVKEPFF